jgi:hypothetical protein
LENTISSTVNLTINNIGAGNANVLDGGANDDVMSGGGGNDRYLVNDTGDLVIENPNEGVDIVVATANYVIVPNLEALYLVGTGLVGTGSNGAEILRSMGGPNTLEGRGGNDISTSVMPATR